MRRKTLAFAFNAPGYLASIGAPMLLAGGIAIAIVQRRLERRRAAVIVVAALAIVELVFLVLPMRTAPESAPYFGHALAVLIVGVVLSLAGITLAGRRPRSRSAV
jgi:peptidoglycan/LPS O-acetylase OafA/YrhL